MALAAPQLAAWLLASGVGAVGVGVAAGVIDIDPYLPWSKPAVESVDNTPTKLAALPEGNKEAAKPAEKAAPIKPSFDIMRVEKDGSVLIAGNAEPGSTVEVLVAGIVTATTKAGTNGDFVVIFDKPLIAGDHELVIRSQSDTNGEIIAAETGLVSIPKDKSGELLVMVTKPGEASRVMQKPEVTKTQKTTEVAELQPDRPADKPETVEVKKATPEAEKPAAVEAKQPVSKPASKPVEVAKLVPAKEVQSKEAPVKKPVEVPAKTEAPIAKVIKTKPETVAKPVDVIQPEKPVDVAVVPKTPAKPLKSDTDPAAPQVEPAAGTKTPTEVEQSEVKAPEIVKTLPGNAAPESQKAEPASETAPKQEVAEVEIAVSKPTPKPVETNVNVTVEAVEVEGNRVFVAGSVTPGTQVLIYIDGVYIGTDTGTPNGRFVVDAERTITRGNHSIRADVIGKYSATVVSRAEVPFIHEPEVEVAVAPAEPAATPKVEAAPTPPASQPENPAVEKTVEETPVKPAVTEIAQAQPPKQAEVAVAPAKPAIEKAPEKVAELPKSTSAQLTPAEPKSSEAAPEKPKPEIVAVETKTAEKQQVEIAAAAPEKTQVQKAVTPLRTGSSVIIRRGDNLWRISRRTYGRGIRYSTIYTANLDQVRNPNRIWPGQILRIPRKAKGS